MFMHVADTYDGTSMPSTVHIRGWIYAWENNSKLQGHNTACI